MELIKLYPPKCKTKNISARIPEKLFNMLEQEREEGGDSLSEIVKKALTLYLSQRLLHSELESMAENFPKVGENLGENLVRMAQWGSDAGALTLDALTIIKTLESCQAKAGEVYAVIKESFEDTGEFLNEAKARMKTKEKKIHRDPMSWREDEEK